MRKLIVIGNPLANTYGLIRSLSICGHSVDLILEPTRFDNIKYSKYVNKVHTVAKIEDIIPLLINNYGNEDEKPIIYSGSDPSISLLDANYNTLKNKFILFNAGGEGLINFYMDKINTFSIAKKNGLHLIKTWVVKPGASLPSDVTYPCLIKGNNSTTSTKQDMIICTNYEELRHSIKCNIEYLVQEFITKEYELDIIGLSYNSGNNVIIPAVVRKIRDDIHRQSVFIRLDNIQDYPDLNIQGLKDFIKDLKYEGIFSIEVIYSHGKFYFLETNLRNDGCAWLYTAAGINYPQLWYLYCTGKLENINAQNIRFKSPLYLMGQDDIYNLIERKVTISQWISDLFKTRAFFFAYFKDPIYFMSSIWIHFKQACKLVRRKLFT